MHTNQIISVKTCGRQIKTEQKLQKSDETVSEPTAGAQLLLYQPAIDKKTFFFFKVFCLLKITDLLSKAEQWTVKYNICLGGSVSSGHLIFNTFKKKKKSASNKWKQPINSKVCLKRSVQ